MTQEDLINDWLIRAKRKTHAHAKSASRAIKLHYLLGVPSVILSAITATAVFAEVESDPTSEYKYIVVGIIVLAAILTSLQTFFKYSELTALHKATSATYSKIRRKAEIALVEIAKQESNKERIDTLISEIEERFNDTTDIEPLIPNGIWAKVESKYPRT